MPSLDTQSAAMPVAAANSGYPRAQRGFVRQLLRAPERKRLDAALGVFGARLQTVTVAAKAGETWAQATLELYERAEHETLHGDLDSGWKFLHEAQRHELCGLSENAISA